MEQNSRIEVLWRRTHPYSAMLRDYQAALEAVMSRLTELRALVRTQAWAETALPQTELYQLEKRIRTLKDEQHELCCDMKEIRGYAEREISWEEETSHALVI